MTDDGRLGVPLWRCPRCPAYLPLPDWWRHLEEEHQLTRKAYELESRVIFEMGKVARKKMKERGLES